jgi:4-hydroxy-tetrahydrodipicolinate reductase
MKIAVLGYGKMGKAIESVAMERGHTIVCKIDSKKEGDIKNADIAINFSIPSSAFNNIKEAINNKIPVVSGTTGWLKDLKNIEQLALQNKVGFLYSSNFSVGVNLFFQLNKFLAKLMKSLNYSIELNEIHHAQKIDSPSGTAISLANDIISNSNYKNWSLDQGNKETLKIKSSREGDFHGMHNIEYNSEFDKITINHESYSRTSYALGAVIAAEWLHGKIGVYSMSDVLKSI